MIRVVLKDIVEKPITGEWGNEGTSVNVLRTTNFTNEGFIDYTKVVKRDIEQKKIDTKRLYKGDIIIEKSGGSPTQPVGRVVYFDSEEIYLCNNFTAILRPKKEQVYPKYLHYILFVGHQFGLTSAFQNKTTGIINLQLPKYIEGVQVPLPSLPQQHKIANILDAADALRHNDKALIAKYDELTQALFLDMFGDPVSSKIIELGEVIKLIGGGTPSKMIDEYWIGTIPWASVKDLKSDLLTSTIDHISEAAIANSATNLIPAGSLIIATRMAVGKTVICLQDTAINQDLKAVKIIGEANVKFLQHLFKSKESYFDSVSSGATVKGIKIEHITKLKVPFPPIELQNQFAERVAVIEEQKAIAQKSLEHSESLFNSLLQKAFKGELV